MGGAVLKLASQGHAVHLVDMTNGEPTPHGTPEIRAKESAAAAKILGVGRTLVGLPNRQVQHTIEARHITCRATLCEVQALAHAPSEADYDAVMAAMRGYDWSAIGLSVGTASADVGRESDDERIIIFLQRHSQP